METVLITGGAGFIGSNIAEAMTSQGYRVVILDDLSTGKMENIEGLLSRRNVSFVRGSILDEELLRETLCSNRVALISHQAARPSVAKSIEEPVQTAEANITGTVKLFHAAFECGCRRVVFASSSSVYGDSPELPKREALPLTPKSPYAASKVAKELFADVFSQLYKLEIVGLRYFNVYGKRQDPSSGYAAVIPKFITKALASEPLTIEGDGLQTRDFAFIGDVVSANLQALTKKDVPGMVFNIAGGSRTSILELARMVLMITSSCSPLVHVSPRSGDIRDSAADITRARKHLDYVPEYDIMRGLEETVRWFREMRPEPVFGAADPALHGAAAGK